MTDDAANEGDAGSDALDGLPDAIDRLKGEIDDLRLSRRRLVSAADADRRAIEDALHGGVQQHLIALAGDLQRLAGLLDADPVAAQACSTR